VDCEVRKYATQAACALNIYPMPVIPGSFEPLFNPLSNDTQKSLPPSHCHPPDVVRVHLIKNQTKNKKNLDHFFQAHHTTNTCPNPMILGSF
jgi:hypothetical protein